MQSGRIAQEMAVLMYRLEMTKKVLYTESRNRECKANYLASNYVEVYLNISRLFVPTLTLLMSIILRLLI